MTTESLLNELDRLSLDVDREYAGRILTQKDYDTFLETYNSLSPITQRFVDDCLDPLAAEYVFEGLYTELVNSMYEGPGYDYSGLRLLYLAIDQELKDKKFWHEGFVPKYQINQKEKRVVQVNEARGQEGRHLSPVFFHAIRAYHGICPLPGSFYWTIKSKVLSGMDAAMRKPLDYEVFQRFDEGIPLTKDERFQLAQASVLLTDGELVHIPLEEYLLVSDLFELAVVLKSYLKFPPLLRRQFSGGESVILKAISSWKWLHSRNPDLEREIKVIVVNPDSNLAKMFAIVRLDFPLKKVP